MPLVSGYTLFALTRGLKGKLANGGDSDQMPQNVASDQGLHCLQMLTLVMLKVEMPRPLLIFSNQIT